ncbi:VIT1/CCC1 transporter family protein [Acidaminobacterium chupaoyuni]
MESVRKFSAETMAFLRKSQENELTESLIYEKIAQCQKDAGNQEVLRRIAAEERRHEEIWRGYTGQTAKPNMRKVRWYSFLCRVLGFTFALKKMESGENSATHKYAAVMKEIPAAEKIAAEEDAHEKQLLELLDEERLQYVGSMVLGLNDALVELTGTIAGMTFALMNTRLVALSGIITGVSATLSMAASNFLAERAAGNENALKSSLYTGVAYLITVALMVLPFLLFPAGLYVGALATMLVGVLLIILGFNYYISVAKSTPFLPRFAEMAIISLSVAAISFVIGLLVKRFLGIDL